MGVDFYACQNCGETYPDCGDYFTCSTCESSFCSDECGGCQVADDDTTSCVLCRVEVILDSDLLDFLLKGHNLTRSEAEALYRADL
jgi:hypothetical protein